MHPDGGRLGMRLPAACTEDRPCITVSRTAIHVLYVGGIFFVSWGVARCTRADVDWLYILRDSGLSWLAGELPGIYTPMLLD